MALIECVDCKAMISDRAPTCPHCGGPVETAKAPPSTPAAAPPPEHAPPAAVRAPDPAPIFDDSPVGKYVDPKQKPRWMHALGLIAVAVIAGTALARLEYGITLTTHNFLGMMTAGIGISLIPLAIALIALSLGYRGGAWITFTLLVAAFGWSGWKTAQDRVADEQAAKVELAKMKADGDKLRAGEMVEGELPPIPKPGYYSDAERMRVARLTYVATNTEFTRELKRIAESERAYPPEEMLKPETLASPEGLRHARAMIELYQRNQVLREAAFRKFGADSDARMLPLLQERPADKADYQARRVARVQKAEDLAKAQRAAIAAIDQLVRLAEAHAGNLQVQDGRLMFPNAESLAEFNRRQRVMIAASAEVQYQVSRYEENRAKAHEKLNAVQLPEE